MDTLRRFYINDYHLPSSANKRFALPTQANHERVLEDYRHHNVDLQSFAGNTCLFYQMLLLHAISGVGIATNNVAQDTILPPDDVI
jgi:hypothetical protein